MTSSLLKTPQPVYDQKQLIQKLIEGDPSGFEFIVREYGSYLMNVACRYIANSSDAQDVVQETYLQAFNNIDKFRGESSIKSWLHRITVNAALMKIRKESSTIQFFADDDSNDDVFDENGKRVENAKNITISVDEVHMNMELRAAIKRHIMALPEAFRNVLLLRDIEGYSIAETAELLNISPASVKTGLHRARNKLKDKLEDSGY